MSVRPSRALALRPAWRCASCSSRRPLSMSPHLQAIGPESPRYIDIPEPPQQTRQDRPQIKGTLPVPRSIFGHGAAKLRGLHKADEASIALKAKLPSTDKSSQSEQRAYKTRMAEMRRESLRQGLKALRERRLRTDTQTQERIRRKHAARQELVHRPEREDERLTRPSVSSELRGFLAGKRLSDPSRAERLEGMRKRTEECRAAAEEERRMALHSLYVNAQSFIVDETRLDEVIDESFGQPDAPVAFGPAGRGASVWAIGAPIGVMEMFKRTQLGEASSGAFSTALTEAEINKRRLRLIAEELTGGKMDES